MSQTKYSKTYLFLRKIGIYLSPEKYGRFSLFDFIKATFRRWKNEQLHRLARGFTLFEPFSSRPIRAILHKWRGVDISNNVFIEFDVMMDCVYPERIHIGSGVILTNRVHILAHNRDLKGYKPSTVIDDADYVVKDVVIEDNVAVEILPGVTIHEGAIIGANSVVNKDIPPYSLAVGSPAKVVHTFE